MTTVKITASKEYNVHIEHGLLARTGEKIADIVGGNKVMLVTDDTVNGLYGDVVADSLKSAGYSVNRFIFSHGEQSKCMDCYTDLLKALCENNLTRSDTVAALGGGVVGDLAGFAAATYLRGVKFVQIPTTLLAMVDSSVGGKTGINLAAGKNQVGSFLQPETVLCDYAALDTLPAEIFTDGCAEVIKHAVIRDERLFELLKKPDFRDNIEEIIALNVAIKRNVVVLDENDTGIRQILNFGHTVGHGIEKHSEYKISHGKAVAIGMAVVSRGAWKLGLCEESCHLDIVAVLERFGLPAETDITPQQLIDAAFADKKRDGNHITLVVPEKIGNCYLKKFTMEELEEFIKSGMAK
jgi:3-dehydroquinate synthase